MYKEYVQISLRRAEMSDVLELEDLIQLSVWELTRAAYSLEQVQSLVKDLAHVDLNLIEDGTLYVAEQQGRIVGCGGWSQRAGLYTTHGGAKGPAVYLKPAVDAAKIRMMFVHPDYARQGIGRQVLEFSELGAWQAGFNHLQLMATLTGVPLYLRMGYEVSERQSITLSDGVQITVAIMEKYLD